MNPSNKVIALMGPSGAGKTELAVGLAASYPTDIISVDSALVYREMVIGTAKPSSREQGEAHHRLIDIIAPNETYSAARFVADCHREMAEIYSKKRIPLLVGGTMLYFRALFEGLSPLPQANAEIREQLEQQASELGWQAMHQQLQEIDPVAAANIHPNDPQRIQRALEVYRITGQSLSQLQGKKKCGKSNFNTLKIIVCPIDRVYLHQRIEKRFDQMLEQGLVDEVKALFERGDLDAETPSMRCVGYRQVWAYLQGQYDFSEMRRRALAATRQLAKRQLTWLRKEEGAIWVDSADENKMNQVYEAVKLFVG